MEFIVILKTILLSFIQGLTEFLPISSTAHLLLTKKLINFEVYNSNLLEITTQLGTTFALIFFYRKKILNLILTFFREKNSRKFCYNIIIATIPVIIFGILFYNIIKNYLNSYLIMATALILGGIFILIVENKRKSCEKEIINVEDISGKTAFKIGIFQALALVPGASRSGMTILGALINNVSRKAAVEFSFFLSIPAIISASVFDLYKNYNTINLENIYMLLISFFITFFVAIFVIKIFIDYISKNDFRVFGYYRIFIGFLVLLLLF